jgi:hypothetical protein
MGEGWWCRAETPLANGILSVWTPACAEAPRGTDLWPGALHTP